MTNRAFHVVYIAIISFLSFQLWSKTTADKRAFEQVERVLEQDFNISQNHFSNLRNEILKNVKMYPSPPMVQNLEVFEQVSSLFENKQQWIDSTILALKQGKTVEISVVNDSIQHFKQALSNHKFSSEMREEEKKLILPQWNRYDTLINNTKQELPLCLNALNNQLQWDKINYTEFLANRIIGVGIICDNYKLAIAPQKAVLIVGDTFEAELYLARYSSVVSEDVKMSSNSTDLPMREGVAHYSKIETTTGKKTFTAEAVITNPLTKTQTTRKNVFEYEVLPKCSRDCQ